MADTRRWTRVFATPVVAAGALALLAGCSSGSGGADAVRTANPAVVTAPPVSAGAVTDLSAPTTLVPSGDDELDAMDADLAAAESELASLDEAVAAVTEETVP